MVPSVLGMIGTRINYDMLDYLPADMDTVVGQNELLEDFGKGAFSFVIVEEKDLAEALEQGEIAAAGLDVLCQEPMSPENPLRGFKDSDRLFITPHIGWASVEARTRLMNIIYHQIRDYEEKPI